MRVLFLSHYFLPEGNAPASRVYELCKRWAHKGYKVTVVTCVPNVPDGIVYPGYKNKVYQRQNIDGVDVVRVWTYVAANRGVVRRFLNHISYLVSSVFFTLFFRRPDVIIATSPQFFCGIAGVILSKICKVPLILEIRDIWPESIPAVGSLSNKSILSILEWLELKMYACAYLIITVGQGYKKRLIEKKVREEKISVIPNGISKDIFCSKKPNDELIKKYKLRGYFICSYVGTIGMACGLDIVINAAKLLKD
ncbi:MAG: glycosyltransferase family 4 protein, partial [Candidatus Omnitrophica bacterium]|nr:glycosyltransferase family 4 protein [Candidatus Omnitrophota bacterium]